MKINYDEPIEVNKEKYLLLTKKYAGIIAHREEEGKYFIRLWNMNFKKQLEEDLLA